MMRSYPYEEVFLKENLKLLLENLVILIIPYDGNGPFVGKSCCGSRLLFLIPSISAEKLL